MATANPSLTGGNDPFGSPRPGQPAGGHVLKQTHPVLAQ